MSTALRKRSEQWMKEIAYPLWLSRGIDSAHGDFYEALTFECGPADMPIRAMVQARQIYSFRLAERLGILPTCEAKEVITRATQALIRHFSLPNGAFAHAVDSNRAVINSGAELYTQSFALFALANAYSLTRAEAFKDRAKQLVGYLQSKRKALGGGFTEIKEGKVLYQSNPHMHLLEACLSWMQTDSDPEWKKLAAEVVTLLEEKFIDPATGALCEHFSEGWAPIRVDGRFIFEPGHHFEWCWLLGNYQHLTASSRLDSIRRRLFELGELHGIRADRGAAVDEVWSDFNIKKSSSRFWPQGERVKAAVQLRVQAQQAGSDSTSYAKAADQALEALFQYLDQPRPGLWMDTWTEQGDFVGDPVKASSLYHIAGALYEYLQGE